MKRMTIVLATATALVGCGDGRASQAVLAPAAPSEAVAANEWYPLSFETLNPCNDEMIVMWGKMHFVSRATSDGNGGFHVGGDANARFEGVGQTTGSVYVASFTTPFSINVRPPYPMTMSDVYNMTFTGRGGETNFSGHFRLFMTVNANGDVTVERGGDEAPGEIEGAPTCQGTKDAAG